MSAFRWCLHHGLPWLVALILGLTATGALAPAVAAAQALCPTGALAATAAVQGAGGALAGTVTVTNQSATTCAVQGIPTVAVLGGNGSAVVVAQTAAPAGAAGGPIDLESGQGSALSIVWTNFCQQPTPAGPYSLQLTLSGGAQLTVPLLQAGTTVPITSGPRCDSPATPSTITVGAFQIPTVTVVPHDNRYFSQTGFRIDNDVIWDYFVHRGGVPTFGYPISRAFLFQGFTVQFFQRRIVQIGPDGSARLLNVLDPGLLPYTSFNFAVFPAYDSNLVASAPSPSDSLGTLAFIQAHAPNSFQGLPVNFYQTFGNTVPAAAAFPTGVSVAVNLLPGFDLEMWGIPTSQPMYDPNNHNFVYLRWQRGIMMYDAGCNCTEGILLADYLKSIITGTNLPPDLAQEAAGSAFFHQYDPGAPNWVRDPTLLPSTDLTNAFTQE
jgi:hypothetical protein